MIISLALKLFLAHIIGDFALQPKSWVEQKEEKKISSKYLYYHILIHLVLLIIILKAKHWGVIAIIVGSHYIIDLIKLYWTKEENRKLTFTLDQIAHLIVLTILVYYSEPFTINTTFFYSDHTLVLAIMAISATFVSSVIQRFLLMNFQNALSTGNKVIDQETKATNPTTQNDSNDNNNKLDSLKNAGAYIGMLERLFVFGFIIMGQWSAIGFLLAAKSVFRFGDLTEAKSRKLTEYVLIGTLLSFGLAIMCGLIYKKILTNL